jgi:hypothetical protein
MTPILFLCIRLSASVSEPSWQDLSLSISREFGVSSDTVTLCRVRVINHGSHTWPGRQIRFVAEALEAGRVVESAHGRFGLSLTPHQTLETLIGFTGAYRQFQVRPVEKGTDRSDARGRGPKGKGKKGRRRR